MPGASYVILARNAHFKLLVDPSSKKKVFTPRSILYECLQNNLDMVEVVMDKIKAEQATKTLRSLTLTGRTCNKELRRCALEWFRIYGWDQDAFWSGHAHVLELCGQDISSYLEVIEEGFYTLHDEMEFHTHLRNYSEGSIVCKRKLINILTIFLTVKSQ